LIPSGRVLGYQLPSVVGHVTAGLGCSNGCDFCCTSHFFRQKYVPFARTGRDIYEALLRTRARAQADGLRVNSFVIIDEDFFLHQRRAREFLDCVREGGESFGLLGFGSVRGLSRFSAREIAEMGFDLVWNAFEGADAGYRKQQGRSLAELYADLKQVGCAQLTSMIIGFPYQDEARIRAELEQLMALEPGLMQCLIYFAFPGTPFHEQVIREERYLPSFRTAPDLRRWDGFAMHFGHPHFERPEQLEALQRAIYDEDFRRLGPSPLRLARVWLTGWQHLEHDPSPLLRARAERLRREARGVLPLITAAVLFAPSAAARERALRLREDIVRSTGAPSASEQIVSALTPLAYLAVRASAWLGILQQPGLLRTEHRVAAGGDGRGLDDPFRLQGGRRAGLGRVILEDIAELARRRVGRRQPPRGLVQHAAVTTRSQPLRRSLPLAPTAPDGP
jgi:hypothetical protein